MFIDDLRARFDSMYTTYPYDGGYKIVTLSDACRYDTAAATLSIAIDVNDYKKNENHTQDSVVLCEVPLPVSNGLVNVNDIYYKFINGLILKDGFYLERGQGKTIGKAHSYSLSFIKCDKVMFKIAMDNELGLCLFLGNKHISIYEYLLGLGVIKTPEDLDEMFYKYREQIEVNQSRTREEIAEGIYKSMFGYAEKGNFSDLLWQKTFEGFYNTTNTYENKHIFFSFARYIGCSVVTCSESGITGMIDAEKARVMDNKHVKIATLMSKCGNKFEVKVDYSDNFTENDLINAIRMLINADRYDGSLEECDKVALYNKKLFTYVDYTAKYVEYRIQQYVNKKSTTNILNGGKKQQVMGTAFFIEWIRNNIEKGKEPVPVNNPMTYINSHDRFLKDLFREDSSSISQKERMFHSTYFGWISPSLTSDGDKVGLTGQFVIDACDDNRIRRSFTFQNNDEGKSDEEEVPDDTDNIEAVTNTSYLEPYQTYNKRIVFMESDGTYNVYMNGNRVEGLRPYECELLCKTDTIKEYLSCKTPAIKSDQGKRQGLGNKAMFQAMPGIATSHKKPTGMKSEFYGKEIGIKARDIINSILSNSGKAVEDTGYTAIFLNSVKTDAKNYILEVSYDDHMIENYIHPIYIPSVAENTRLKFHVAQSKNGNCTYALDDYVLVCGKYDDVGEECNILFANLEGGTYEDGITITSDFIRHMGLSTKLYFTQKILIDGPIDEHGVRNPGVNYLDDRGLPKIGAYIKYNSVLCAVMIGEEQKTVYSDKYGYVEEVTFGKTKFGTISNIKITLSSIRTLRPGDKMSNCHGNKGVIVYVIDSSDIIMESGPKPDIIVNPNGTVGRMNMGQIKEMLGNSLSESSDHRLTFAEAKVDTSSIRELTKATVEAGGYKDVAIFYKGCKLVNSVYIGKMTMYRMKQFSELHLKSSTSARLNVNQVVDSGQKMSELATNVHEAFNCSEELKYMMVYQSRNPKATKELEHSIISERTLDTTRFKDTSKYRVSAMMCSMGFKMTQTGITYLTNSDIDHLPVVDNVTDSLIRQELHGKFDISNMNGYKLAAVIDVGSDIIMPNILAELLKFVKFMDPTGEKNTINGTNNVIKSVCMTAEYEISLTDDKSAFLYRPYDKKNVNNGRYQRGYFALVRLLGELSITGVLDRLADDKNPKNYLYFQRILANCDGENIFKLVTLKGVPVAPINLRPSYKGRSGQGIDGLYAPLLRALPQPIIFKNLSALCDEFKAQLFQHSEATATGNELSHAAKKAEIRDATVARRYLYSCRSVAGFDLNLRPYEIAIPIKLLMYTLEGLVLEEASRKYQSHAYNNNDIKLFHDKYEEVITDISKVKDIFRGTMSDIYSDCTCNVLAKEYIVDALNKLIKNKACSMVREPILRRQGNYYYLIKICEGDAIKSNPLICPSYNLDFDGDTTPEYLCLDDNVSANFLRKMNPYFGMYDLDSDKVWIKPNQDPLFGLYQLTKGKATDKPERILSNSDNILSQLNFEIRYCGTDLGQTIEIREQGGKSKIVDTIGNLMLLYTIIKDPFQFDQIGLPKLLSKIDEGITNNNIGDFIRYLDFEDVAYEDGYVMITDENSPLYGEKSAMVLDMINRITKLGYDIVTFQGVTLKPSDLAQVRDKEEILEQGRKIGRVPTTEVFSNDTTDLLSQLKIGEELIKGEVATQEQQYINECIAEDIDKIPYLRDLLKSGARGKMSDMVNMWNRIGSVVYDGKSTEINTNFSRGTGYIDMMIASQAVRAAKVDTQCNLGTASNAIKEKQLLASSLKFRGNSCNGETIKLPVRYRVMYLGKDLSKCDRVLIQDEDLLDKLNKVLMCKGETKFPGSIVSMMVQKHSLRELNGSPLEYYLSNEFKSIVGTKYLNFDGKTVLGRKVIDRIQEELPLYVDMYSLYGCTEENGICRRCYGEIDNQLKLDAVGMNTVFSIGQNTIQYTLDAAKLTGGKVKRSDNIELMSLYTQSTVSGRSNPVPANSLNIKYANGKTTIQQVRYSERGAATMIKEYDINNNYFDVNWNEHDFFIPLGYINFEPLNDNKDNSLLENVYCNMLYEFVNSVSVRSLDLIMCMNTRYVMTDTGTKEFAEGTTEYPRRWLCDREYREQQDVLVNLILSDPMSNLLKNALSGKTYRPNSTILSDLLDFDKIGNVVKLTSDEERKYNKEKELSRAKWKKPTPVVEYVPPQDEDIPQQELEVEDEYTEEVEENITDYGIETTSEFE